MNVRIVRGDLLAQDVDVIVNAANTHLEHMGGIAGVISRAGGPEIQAHSRRLRPIPTGGVAVTTAGNLPFKAIIHAVGPIYKDGNYFEDKLLAAAYRNALKAAAKHGWRSVGFPAISCGIFRYPAEEGARVAVETVRSVAPLLPIDEVRFCLVVPEHVEAWTRAMAQ